jgi:uncharacterized protein YndB with AHSA1/START domain
MPTGGHAVLRDHEGRHALVVERVLAGPPERVWRALVAPEELAQWHPTPFQLEPSPVAPGGRVSFLSGAGMPELPDGELLTYEPPHAISYTWGGDELRWELSEHDGGSVLRLTHIFDDRFKAARDASGWHLCLQALSDSLREAPAPLRGSSPRLPEGWAELNRDYQQRFGIPPEQATPPPTA